MTLECILTYCTNMEYNFFFFLIRRNFHFFTFFLVCEQYLKIGINTCGARLNSQAGLGSCFLLVFWTLRALPGSPCQWVRPVYLP